MTSEIKLIVVKFMIIIGLTIAYIFILSLWVVPWVMDTITVHAQQPYPPDQFQQPYNDPYSQQGGFNQGYNQGYQQQYDPYSQGQYGMQGQYGGYQQYSPYGMQGQYGVPPQQAYGSNTVLGFGIQEIVTALIAGGGATAYARRRTNKLEEDKQLIMAEMMRDKQKLAELARVSYEKMPKGGYEVTDAPSVKLETLNNDIDKFTGEVAKA